MLSAILIDENEASLSSLESLIRRSGLGVQVSGQAQSAQRALELIHLVRPRLVFLGIHRLGPNYLNLLQQLSEANVIAIIVTERNHLRVEMLKYGIAGCLHYPVGREDLTIAVQNAVKRLRPKESPSQEDNSPKNASDNMPGGQLIGVPTVKGFDFFHVEDIIRCEGLNRCTRIVTRERSNIVSSYHLGEFRRLLRPYAFFSPHRSHLINLSHVRHFNREGTITMDDGSHVPVARRKKNEFLNLVVHI